MLFLLLTVRRPPRPFKEKCLQRLNFELCRSRTFEGTSLWEIRPELTPHFHGTSAGSADVTWFHSVGLWASCAWVSIAVPRAENFNNIVTPMHSRCEIVAHFHLYVEWLYFKINTVLSETPVQLYSFAYIITIISIFWSIPAVTIQLWHHSSRMSIKMNHSFPVRTEYRRTRPTVTQNTAGIDRRGDRNC